MLKFVHMVWTENHYLEQGTLKSLNTHVFVFSKLVFFKGGEYSTY